MEPTDYLYRKLKHLRQGDVLDYRGEHIVMIKDNHFIDGCKSCMFYVKEGQRYGCIWRRAWKLEPCDISKYFNTVDNVLGE